MAKGDGNRGKGKCIAFLRSFVDYQGDDCILWPFSRDICGYGMFGYDGKTSLKAHRWMCEQKNGPAPTPAHEAAHSCGNGHNGCITPGHLSWKTRVENMEDAIRHGTTRKGKRNGLRKLTQEQVSEILELRGQKTHQELADTYGVKARQISRIFSGYSWKNGKPQKPGGGGIQRILTDEEVRRIKAAEHGTAAALAREMGLDYMIVHRVRSGKSYAHVKAEGGPTC